MIKLRMLSVAVAAVAMVGQVATAQEPRTPKEEFIVGGEPAVEGAFPWQVALIGGDDAEGQRGQFCGGSIVAPEWVLTAAHCVDNFFVQKDPANLDVVAGTLKYADGGERVDATAIIVHPNWDDPSFDFDAALIKLSAPLKMGAAISLAAANAEIPVDFTVRVSGWGATTEGGAGSEDLLFVDVPAVTNETCNKPESYDGRVTDQMLCAGKSTGGFDSCQGDSGGPAVAEITDDGFTLVGVVSWGTGCARPLFYGIYTRVSTISEWVTETIAAN